MPVPYIGGANMPSGYNRQAGPPQYYGDMKRWAELQDFTGGRMDQADQSRGGSRNQYQDAIMRMGQFDPMSFMQRAAGAAYTGISRDFGQAESARKAGLNRRGLVSDVGGHQAQNRYYQALAEAMGNLSMQAGNMTMDRDRGVTSAYQNLYGMDTDQSNMYFDALYGATTSRKAQDYQEKEAKRNRNAAMIGGVLGAAGSIGSAMMPTTIRYR
jgi:hypothetical protein